MLLFVVLGKGKKTEIGLEIAHDSVIGSDAEHGKQRFSAAEIRIHIFQILYIPRCDDSGVTVLGGMGNHSIVFAVSGQNSYGISVMQYVQNKKMAMAKHYIMKGDSPGEVCRKCGYTEYSTFYRAYVREFGCSPKGKDS